ncbi:MAG: thioredoxin domain-containing protein [Geobacteraceae bacterium]|nr:thioredoxin domain-containing protein [Geobacteraceae bacterium]
MNNRELEELLAIDRTVLPDNGGTEFNRLIFSRSPYLLQHARNPVKWREWGDDALNEAKCRDLPLFISIGYSTCHWCHVMAHESFEDNEVADLLNSSFIPVKVDREERPDLDDFYMTAARALTGGGGWPLNVFVDHEKRPFFSITYLPKYPRFKTPGFIDLLKNISTLWQKQRELIRSNAESLIAGLATSTIMPAKSSISLENCRTSAFSHLEEIYDHAHGGFGMAVKFPMPTYLLFLLTSSGKAEQMALHTLDKIIDGGIHDQIGGGFHRYAVDRKWITPHFEKMLYDQALLITSLCQAYKTSGKSEYLKTAEKTALFCIRELQDTTGGFCAGIDADSEGGEGFYYTWSEDELNTGLSDVFLPLADYWQRGDEYRLDDRLILCPSMSLEKFAAKAGISPEKCQSIYAQGCSQLLTLRSTREAPLKDLKIVCAWNGLLISAFVHLYEVSKEPLWLRHATVCATAIIEKMFTPYQALKRTILGDKAGVDAFVEDYALLATALADICRHDKGSYYLENLKLILKIMMAEFISVDGEVRFTTKSGEQLPLALPTIQDNVTPSAAASAAIALMSGGLLSGDQDMIECGELIVQRYRGFIEKSPAACLSMILAAEMAEKRK